jgi:TetR/AcrR family transcriptional regulator, transcriptional repressor for nem operon
MRYPAGHKEQTRAKILRAAGKVFRRHGYHGSGVDRIMQKAGLTAGGFYAHFRSKEALLAEVMRPAKAEAGVPLDRDLEGVAGRARLETFVASYLSQSHLRRVEGGCPLPALVSEVARTSRPVKASFEAIVRDLVAQLRGPGGERFSEDRALAIVALCVGGLGLARSVQHKALGARILTACRHLARAGLASDTPALAKPPRKQRRK